MTDAHFIRPASVLVLEGKKWSIAVSPAYVLMCVVLEWLHAAAHLTMLAFLDAFYPRLPAYLIVFEIAVLSAPSEQE